MKSVPTFKTTVTFEPYGESGGQFRIEFVDPHGNRIIYEESPDQIRVETWLPNQQVPQRRVDFPHSLETQARAHHLFHKLTKVSVAHCMLYLVSTPLTEYSNPGAIP